jgi:flavodoxin
MKTLVAYFSAEGTTARLAKELAGAACADIFEIRPVEPYTAADIKWTNPLARCNREKLGGKFVPAKGKAENFADYDAVMLGFPIWYYGAPNIINTFCRDYDWTGKKVYIFATSGGSGIGKTAEKLAPYLKGAQIMDARVVRSAGELKDWTAKE